MYRRLLVACAALSMVGALAAGCGSDDNSSGAGGGSASTAAAATTASGNSSALQATLNKWYTGGYFGHPPTAPNPVVRNKSVWLISCSNGIPSCTNVWDAAGGVAKSAGWKVTRVDGKQNPNVQGNAIRQAIAAHADLIGVSSIDCAAVKGPLEEAKKANIPVVSSTGLDCDPPLFSANNVANGTSNYKAALEQLGGIEGLWVASKLNPLGGGQVIVEVNPFTEAGNAITAGAKDAVKKWCPKCQIIDLVLNAPDFVPPKAQQKAQALLAKYPQAKALIALTDDVILAGVGSAIAASGRTDKDFFVASGAASPQGIKLMRQNSPQVDFNVGISAEGRGYELFDAMLSLLHGTKPVPAGNAWQAFDKTRGMPTGADYVAPVDFKSLYYKRWGMTQ
jgi:ribose transport system substrate-binding protein